ncbi:MAG TPA: hypothetical protein VFC00_07610 [Micromonosporaceae bacterium]|nr:hypothetical protein [Micromonosporaceae bacterium]
MMGVHIGATAMTGATTRHHAEAAPGEWRVTWLPDRLLTRNQAVTAMVLAEAVAATTVTSEHRLWPHIDAWAAELGLSGPAAVVAASLPVGEVDP